jgi:hypothetical protein
MGLIHATRETSQLGSRAAVEPENSLSGLM